MIALLMKVLLRFVLDWFMAFPVVLILAIVASPFIYFCANLTWMIDPKAGRKTHI